MVLIPLPKIKNSFGVDGSLIYSPGYSNIDKFTALSTDVSMQVHIKSFNIHK